MNDAGTGELPQGPQQEKPALRARHNFAVLCVLAVIVHSVLPSYAADRVVSLNLCTDQMLVLLAPWKVAALSSLARDPALSFVAREAADHPVVRASAEAVLHLHPDLVLAAPFGAQTTLALLAAGRGSGAAHRTAPGFRRHPPGDAPSGEILGVPVRGDALLVAMGGDLDALPHPAKPRRALVWQPRGLTAGPGTLMDAVLRSVGLINASDGRRVGLEALLTHPPDLLVVPAAPEFPSLATALLDHPALAGIARRAIPPALTICAGPFTARAAALLAQ